MTGPITVSEIFGPVVQGEGPLAGLPTVFVRTGGCDFRCSWCDTMYAVDPFVGKREWTREEPEDVAVKVRDLAGGRPLWVTLSGGNPAMHRGVGELIAYLQPHGFKFAIETQGTLFPDWARALDLAVVSPKPPSSGMVTNWAALDNWMTRQGENVLKVVIFDDDDLRYLDEVRARYPVIRTFAQPGNSDYLEDQVPDPALLLDRYRWLSGAVIERGWFDVAVLPQLHVLTHGGGRGI